MVEFSAPDNRALRRERPATPMDCRPESVAASGRQNTQDEEQTSQPDMEVADEELLKRLLACKRLSEGCALRIPSGLHQQLIAGSGGPPRKGSIHAVDEQLLPPVTEGQMMLHHNQSYHQSIQLESSGTSSSASSISQRGLLGIGRSLSGFNKRASQDDMWLSLSSSLDSSPPSSQRRRSSTVSQCSSVLSETTRAQLNFDLSPDLPPDSTILEANMLDVGRFNGDHNNPLERPPTPEPFSFESSSEDSMELTGCRSVSRLSKRKMALSQLSDSDDSQEIIRCLNAVTSDEIEISIGDAFDTSESLGNELRMTQLVRSVANTLVDNLRSDATIPAERVDSS